MTDLSTDNPMMPALTNQESGGDPDALSPKGAAGAYQIMPSTARDPGYGVKPLQGWDGNDPRTAPIEEQHRFANDYLTATQKANGGSPQAGAASYNAGPGAVSRAMTASGGDMNSALTKLPQETQDYVPKVSGKQYASNDTGTATDATVDAPKPTASRLPLLLEAERRGILPADKQALLTEARSRGLIPQLPGAKAAAAPSFTSDISRDVVKNLQDPNGGAFGQAMGIVGDVGGEAIKRVPGVVPAAQAVSGAMHSGAQSVANAIDNPTTEGIANSAGNVVNAAGDYIDQSPNLKSFLGGAKRIASGMGTLTGVGDAAASIPSIVEGAGPFLKNTASGGADVKPTAINTAPPIDPRVAQLVRNAEDLGVKIPTRVFSPGSVSGGLNAIGFMPGNTMKADVTNALSKIMGHSGTPNLDIGTLSSIQGNIGKRMNDFALKADKVGGIPASLDDLKAIETDTIAPAEKTSKIISSIENRLDENGRLSGADYQALTRRGGLVDQAIGNSSSDVSGFGKQVRSYLDRQLQSVVPRKDAQDFALARMQYRTSKIIQPLVEKGGVLGQPDSGSALFHAVQSDYGGMANVMKYNPSLGTLAQVANEFPESLASGNKPRIPLNKTLGADAIGALTAGHFLGAPAAAFAAAAVPVAYGAGKILSSDMWRNAILDKSLAGERGAIAKEAIKPLSVAEKYEKENPENNFFNRNSGIPISEGEDRWGKEIGSDLDQEYKERNPGMQRGGAAKKKQVGFPGSGKKRKAA